MIRAPFPWFGGKALAADLLWARLGADIGTFVEPFAGSCAVALNRPPEFAGWITINDLDCLIANFWRSMIAAPADVAHHASSPVNECDLHARHLWLVNNKVRIRASLTADPDYCDPRAAGWWAWGCCSWIGSGWCDGTGPWQAVPGEDGTPEFRKVGNSGIKKQLPHLGAGQGVNRQLPHLGDAGQGVSRKLPQLNAGRGVNKNLPPGVSEREAWLNVWFAELSELLSDSRVTCGSWERICSPGTMTRNGIAGVLLDPPYSLTEAVYAEDSTAVSSDVRAWCKANGDNPLLRIALCGHTGEGHEELEGMGWDSVTWTNGGGYQGADDRERIWFSPHCLASTMGGLFEVMA